MTSMSSFSFPLEIINLILDQLPSTRDVASLARTGKRINFYVTPFLCRKVTINVRGPRTRLKALRMTKALAGNLGNLQLVREFTILGFWRRRDEARKWGRRQNADVSDVERTFGTSVCDILLLMKNLVTFKWCIIAYIPPMIGSVLLRHERMQALEVFVDPQIQSLKVGHEMNGVPTDFYPASIIPFGLHSLKSLHILQLGTFRDCACYGDIIHASPGLQSLWVDVSPTLEIATESFGPLCEDIVSLLLRRRMRIHNGRPSEADGTKLKLTDLRLGRLKITMAGVLALQDCVDLNYMETLVLHLCTHNELVPFLIQRTPNLIRFRGDEEADLSYLEEFLRYNAAATKIQETQGLSTMVYKRPLEKLWVSCQMTRDDGLANLSPYLKLAGMQLRSLCLDINWGEFERPEEVLKGCSQLQELGVWIECEGDQWEALATAVSTHRCLRNLCIFNTSTTGGALSDEVKSRLYSCVKSNRLGRTYFHHQFNEDGEDIGSYQGSYNAPKGGGQVGDLQHVAMRYDLRDEGLVLTTWKVLVSYTKEAIMMEQVDLNDVEGTNFFRDVMQIEYFYPWI